MKKIFSVLISAILIFQICFMTASAVEDNENLNLLVLGDSIAAGTGLVYPEECCYASLIAKAENYNCRNAAYSGNTARSLKWSLEYSSDYDYIPFTVKYVMDADIIIISAGGNDLLWGNLVEKLNQALFHDDYTLIDFLIEEYYRNIKEIVMSINKINPEATLLIQTLYNPRFDVLANVYQYATDNLNRMLRKVEQELPGFFHIVDVASDLGRNPFYYSVDTLHPNKAGHYAIAKSYLRVLNDLGLGTELIPPRQPTIFEIPDYFDKLMAVIKEYMAVIKGFLN